MKGSLNDCFASQSLSNPHFLQISSGELMAHMLQWALCTLESSKIHHCMMLKVCQYSKKLSS